MRFLNRLRKPKDRIDPSKEEVLLAQRVSEKFRRSFEGYVFEPSVAEALERAFLAEGCRDYGMVLLGEKKCDSAIEEFKRAYLLIPHPGDFCMIAIASEEKGDYEQMRRALNQAQTELLAPERAISTAERLLSWLGAEVPGELAAAMVHWMDTYALERIWPEGVIEIRDSGRPGAARQQIVAWVTDTTRELIKEAANPQPVLCPHCRAVAAPATENRTCQQCGATVVIVVDDKIIPLFSPDTWTGNPCLDYVVEHSQRGSDFSNRFGRLKVGLTQAAEIFGRYCLSFIEEDGRGQAAANLEGLELLGVSAEIRRVFSLMIDYFEDPELASSAIDALAIEVLGVQVETAPLVRRYWLDLKEEERDRFHMLLGFDAGRLLAEGFVGIPIALIPAMLLEYDTTTMIKEALYDQPVDLDKREQFLAGLIESASKLGNKSEMGDA